MEKVVKDSEYQTLITIHRQIRPVLRLKKRSKELIYPLIVFFMIIVAFYMIGEGYSPEKSRYIVGLTQWSV